MAGNGNSGAGIAFRMSEDRLKQRMDDFREEYGQGQHDMVTWEAFCAFLGYSVEKVQECYLRGKNGQKNAYSGRAEMLEDFYTEVLHMMFATCGKKQSLAKELAKRDYLHLEKSNEAGGKEVHWTIDSNDGRCMEIMK